jgi:putative transposase
VSLATYAHFADHDPLTRVVLGQMLAGVSCRRFSRTREPVGQDVVNAERSTSKSAVSREFVGRTSEHLSALMSRSLEDVRLAALMLDGIELKGRCCVVALGVTTDGVKVPLGLWDGSTENKTATVHLLADLVARGLDVEQGVLCVIDGARALRKAVRDVLGVHTPVQRCVRHKNATCSTTCPSATARPSRPGCAAPGLPTTTRSRSTGCARSPQSLSDRTPARPHRCARGWRRRSPSPVSASAAT